MHSCWAWSNASLEVAGRRTYQWTVNGDDCSDLSTRTPEHLDKASVLYCRSLDIRAAAVRSIVQAGAPSDRLMARKARSGSLDGPLYPEPSTRWAWLIIGRTPCAATFVLQIARSGVSRACAQAKHAESAPRNTAAVLATDAPFLVIHGPNYRTETQSRGARSPAQQLGLEGSSAVNAGTIV